jgi:hypothetical protein
MAELAHDETERAALLRMADQWGRLADHKAKIESLGLDLGKTS